MPNYSYKAINHSGKIIRGKVVAISEKEAELWLQGEGLTLISSKEETQSPINRIFTRAKIKTRLLIELYRRLSQTLEMGLPIITALEENSKMLPSRVMKKTLDEIRVSIQSGKTIHEAISRHENIFTKLDLGIILVGEQAGIMPKCFNDLADLHEWKERIKSTINKAAIYPCFVMLALLAVVGVWVGYVLPQMASLLTEMGVAIPLVTKIVLNVSIFIHANWKWLMGSFAAIGVMIYLLGRHREGAIILQKYLLQIPWIGRILYYTAMARLCHYFAAMHDSGMSLSAIFDILTNGVVGNRYLESRIAKVHEVIQLGSSIADSFKKVSGFPALLISGIRNGETTGMLDDAFTRLGNYYDEEVKRSVQTMLSNIEPLTIILMGGVFGVIILSILLPLYDVFGQLGQSY